MKPIIQNRLLFPFILKKWPRKIHKKQRPKILIIAGSNEMVGAAALVAKAAFRSGAGIVTLAIPASLKKYYPQIPLECLLLPCPQTKVGSLSLKSKKLILEKSKEYEVVVLGPGLSRYGETQKLVQDLVKNLAQPLILDADGLTALAKKIFLLPKRKFPTILTPHEGEMARLCQTTVDFISKNRINLAAQKAKEWNLTLVLKGYKTVIAGKLQKDKLVQKDFSKIKTIINESGGPSLATAGTGDVLAGIMAVMWAENLKYPTEAAATAVFLHGKAGERAAKILSERSVMATDVIEALPAIIKKFYK